MTGGSPDREEVKGVPRRRHISLNNLKKSPFVPQIQCFGSRRILHPRNTTSLHDDVQQRLSAQPLHSSPCPSPRPPSPRQEGRTGPAWSAARDSVSAVALQAPALCNVAGLGEEKGAATKGLSFTENAPSTGTFG